MCSSFDGSHIFVAGADGCLIIYEIKEKDFAGKSLGAMGRDDTTGKAIYAQEILVTKTDIEEQAGAMRELQSKVDELHIHSEYQLRLKDMDANEKIKEVTEKFTQELEGGRSKYDMLQEEKEDMRLEYTYKIEALETKQKREIEEMQRNYKSKIDAEVSRYNELEDERERSNREWDEKNEMV